MHRRNPILTVVLLALFALAVPPAAQAAPQDVEATRLRMQLMKAAQQRRMLQGPLFRAKKRAARFERGRLAMQRALAERKAEAKRAAAARKAGARMKPVSGERLEQLREAAQAERGRKALVAAVRNAEAALAPNRIINNPFPDLTGAGQSELSIAVDGSHCVAAWNDGQGYNYPPNHALASTQGYAWSNDGGTTWYDGGIPPTTNIGRWASDPVVTVNEKTHRFYFAALCDPPTSTNNGIGVVEGQFVGVQDTLRWGTPSLARQEPSSTVLLDKEWIAADSTNNRLYLIYARFVLQFGQILTNHIDFQFATNPGGPAWGWSTPALLSSAGDAGYVQGARVLAGPAGEVYTTWMAIGQLSNSYWGRDYLRMRKSTTMGTSFGAQTTPDSMFANWGSGCPGFNRPTGITFPGMGVDRTSGPNRGRVYLTWNEAINFYWDNLAYLPQVIETENNNSAGAADPFTPGAGIKGQILSGDVDYWRFNATAGQTIILFADTVASSLDFSHELLCADGATSVGFSNNGYEGSTLIVYTLPATATYYLKLQAAYNSNSTGIYTIATGLHTPRFDGGADRARDHRDIYVKSSANGTTWTGAPSLASTGPAGFDDYLPEVAIGGNGKPYVAWYAFHDAPAGVCLGAGGNTYLARSDDAGASWSAGSPVTDTTTVWTANPIFTNIEPNLGDYIGLFADAAGVYVAWADGRRGSPDAFMARIDLGYTAVAVSLVGTQATPDAVRLEWVASEPVTAALERSTGDGWTVIATLTADGSGRLAWEDRDVTPGGRYGYRLMVTDEQGTRPVGETWVEVPAAAAFALRGAQPNPSAGVFRIAFALPDAAAARLELVDVSGRRVAGQEVGSLGAGHHVVDLTGGRTLPAGVYLVRLTRAGQTLTRRVSVVR